jgi:hypothetical protein
VFVKVIAIVRKDSTVKSLIWQISSLDNLAIANGSVDYSDDDSVEIAIVPNSRKPQKGKDGCSCAQDRR